MRSSRFLLIWCWILLAVFAFAGGAWAQLAGNFSNVTGIKVKKLTNAVQVEIQTDGTVRFGGDFDDWVDTENGWNLRPTTSVRLRIVRARAKLPSYVPIDVYPIDGAAISPGQTPFRNPYFSDNAGPNDEPRVDVELRFATPVLIRRFAVEPHRATWFGNYINPKEASVELATNRRSIVVTIIPDRSDLGAASRLDRSPKASRPQKLSVLARENGDLRLEALHTPLRDVLATLGGATNLQFAAREDVQDLNVSLFLEAPLAQILDTLAKSANLGAALDGETVVFGRGDEFFESKTFVLRHLSPDAARLTFPDFLLPFLRVDRQKNALLAFQTPPVLEKIARDLAVIDTPRAQFEIEAQVWELTRTRDSEFVWSFVRGIGRDRQSLDSVGGLATVRVESGQTAQLLARLRALQNRGGAKLVGSPRVSVVSGATGTLFLGQPSYVKVLRQSGSNQIAQAIPLQIGAELRVSPRGAAVTSDSSQLDSSKTDSSPSDSAEKSAIFLEISPRISTVDAVENVTGLPTIGLREVSSSLRLQSGDAVLVAGLEADLAFQTRSKTLKVLPAFGREREKRQLFVLVRATRLSS